MVVSKASGGVEYVPEVRMWRCYLVVGGQVAVDKYYEQKRSAEKELSLQLKWQAEKEEGGKKCNA